MENPTPQVGRPLTPPADQPPTRSAIRRIPAGRWIEAKRPFSLLVWSSVVAPVPLLGLSLIFEGSARWQSAASSIDASGIAALGYVVIVSTFFGYGVWYRLMSRHPASTVAPFTLLVPVVGILTAWLVRGEHPTWGELLGALIVLVGLALALGLVDARAVQRRAAARAVPPISS
jgi:O-acetylserine/cysteine efflux transporter